MKFNAKVLVAAVALSVSSFANAAITSSGDGSLWLTLVDTMNKKEIFFDTGFKYSQFNEIGTGLADSNWGSSTTPFQFNLSTNTIFNTFIASADLSNTFYTVFAGDNSGTLSTAGSRGFVTSYDKTTDLTSVSLSRANIVDINGGHDLSVQNSPSDNTSFATYYGGGNIKGYGLGVTAKLGDTLGLVQYVSNGTGTSNFVYANATVSFNQTGALDISNAVTTPVPEADTYALFLAGLSLMGVITRRRLAAK